MKQQELLLLKPVVQMPQQSNWDEVSDIELWMTLHHGPQDEDMDVD